MKNVLRFISIGIVLILIGCNKDNQSNEFNPLALLANIGNASLTVTATYTGTEKTGEVGVSDGTGKIYVYLYRSLGGTTRSPEPVYVGKTSAAVTQNVPATITINHIKDGEYYILVFYDYKAGDNADNKTDRYVLYSDTAYTAGASKYLVTGDTTLAGVSFGDTNQLDNQSYFMSSSTYTVSVDATFTGTESTDDLATKKLYVYLYSNLGDSTRIPSPPVKTGVSDNIVEPGVAQTISVSGVVPGNYYALVFYDSINGTNIDSENDPYVFFANTPYKSNAQQFVVSVANGDVTLPAVSFGDGNVLQTDGVYKVPSSLSTLTVTAQYTGDPSAVDVTGTKKIYVYLYSLLGDGTRDTYLPIYTGATDDPVAQNVDDNIVLSGIVPGDYYMLVFFDYKKQTNNIDGKTDKYVLYNGTRYMSEADLLIVDDATETLGGVTIGTWSLLDGGLYISI